MEADNSGFLMISKEKGWTSFDVVAKLRKITGIKKIGHCGTLDPMAQGLLIVAVGRQATKKISHFANLDKEYVAKVKFGMISQTYDAEGQIESVMVDKIPTSSVVKKCVQSFVGEIMQTPPAFSAKKIHGQPAYKLARKGEKIVLKPVEVKIQEIKILDYEWPNLKLKINCSKGTYIRSLAHDLGEKLQVGGYLTYLNRTKIGSYNLKKAVKISQLSSLNWTDFLEKLNNK